MSTVIDFDNPTTFPKKLCEWSKNFERMIISRISLDKVTEGWQIEHQLQDIHIFDMNIVTDFLLKNMETEVAVCHCTRILDVDQYRKEGLITGGGCGSTAEHRLRKLLYKIGLGDDQIYDTFSHIYHYWERDKESRTECVHFFIDKSQAYKDDKINHFAINIGGEILRWSIEDIDRNLYKQEPYKRLWIIGTPSIVKFKCKLSNIYKMDRNALIAEVVKYFIVTKMFNYPYEFELTGRTIRNIPPEDIIYIEEIQNFIELQEKYSDFEKFYDELKY